MKYYQVAIFHESKPEQSGWWETKELAFTIKDDALKFGKAKALEAGSTRFELILKYCKHGKSPYACCCDGEQVKIEIENYIFRRIASGRLAWLNEDKYPGAYAMPLQC